MQMEIQGPTFFFKSSSNNLVDTSSRAKTLDLAEEIIFNSTI
jgi:hypothetical protein